MKMVRELQVELYDLNGIQLTDTILIPNIAVNIQTFKDLYIHFERMIGNNHVTLTKVFLRGIDNNGVDLIKSVADIIDLLDDLRFEKNLYLNVPTDFTSIVDTNALQIANNNAAAAPDAQAFFR